MFRPLFLEHSRMMVRLGLARSPVQPFLENKSSSQLSAISSQLVRFKLTAES
jgi:hypothetical protein